MIVTGLIDTAFREWEVRQKLNEQGFFATQWNL